VDAAGGIFNSLAVDSHGWAHIAYNSPNSAGLHYAYWDGKAWRKFVIDTARTSHGTSIQLDSQGHAGISYYRDEYSDHRLAQHLKYAYFDDNIWYIQTVDHRSGTGKSSSLAFGRADRPCISYSIEAAGPGLACQGAGSNWEQTLAEAWRSQSKRHSDSTNSLVLGPEGETHLAYIDTATRTVNYVSREGADWSEETLDVLVSTGADSDRVSLRLDGKGQPHVIYNDSGLGVLKYATRDKQGWHTEVIDTGEAGGYASLSLDENDQPYVIYYAGTEKELRIAHPSPREPMGKH